MNNVFHQTFTSSFCRSSYSLFVFKKYFSSLWLPTHLGIIFGLYNVYTGNKLHNKYTRIFSYTRISKLKKKEWEKYVLRYHTVIIKKQILKTLLWDWYQKNMQHKNLLIKLEKIINSFPANTFKKWNKRSFCIIFRELIYFDNRNIKNFVWHLFYLHSAHIHKSFGYCRWIK